MKIECIDNSDQQELVQYALRNSASLIYGTPRYLTLISKHLAAYAGWLIAKQNKEIVGLLPFIKKDGPLGPVFNSLAYYGSNGGVIQHETNEEAKIALIKEFYEMAKKAKSVSATIITNPLLNDFDFYHKHTHYDLLDERIGQITHFPSISKPEDLLHSFQDPRPRNIRRALREGIVVERRQDHDALYFLYSTHVANIESIGGIPKKLEFFQLLKETMNEAEWTIYVGKTKEEPIAALLLLYFNRTVEYFTPVIREAHRNKQALSLIIYQAMLDAITEGYENWNWGGTWLTQTGVYDFKKRWGTTDYPYYYYIKLFNNIVKTQTKEALLEAYPGFYVLPFSKLKNI